MSSFTYETGMPACKLETFEWDNVWIDHANDPNTTRVLYVGDSISCATRGVATKATNNQIYFDGFGTSKALDNPFFADALLLFAKQQPNRHLTVFNNGLHGWHLEDQTEYPLHYRAFVQELRQKLGDAPLALVLTTCVADPARNARVEARNAAVIEIAAELGLDVIDFYRVSTRHKDLLSADGVHFTAAGYECLAAELIQEVKRILNITE